MPTANPFQPKKKYATRISFAVLAWPPSRTRWVQGSYLSVLPKFPNKNPHGFRNRHTVVAASHEKENAVVLTEKKGGCIIIPHCMNHSPRSVAFGKRTWRNKVLSVLGNYRQTGKMQKIFTRPSWSCFPFSPQMWKPWHFRISSDTKKRSSKKSHHLGKPIYLGKLL